ncbi:MAG: hypothetical protein AAFP91_17210 [Pseudomonadota bacterium]
MNAMPRAISNTAQLLGPRPRLRLVVEDQFVREIWVEGRAPIITVHDYDWGETDTDPAFDEEGFAFSTINWRRPAWMLGLSFHPPFHADQWSRVRTLFETKKAQDGIVVDQ